MQPHTSQISTVLFSLFWLGIILLLLLAQSIPLPLLVLSLLSSFLLSVMLFRGPSKFSATSGKILIVMSVFITLSYVLGSELQFSNPDWLIPLAAIITGLYIERISPHQQLHAWMILGIATKVQIILILALMANASTESLSIQSWWIVVFCTVTGILLLVRKKLDWYRRLVVLTSVTALGLTVVTLTTLPLNPFLSAATLAAFLWPVIMMSVAGRKSK